MLERYADRDDRAVQRLREMYRPTWDRAVHPEIRPAPAAAERQVANQLPLDVGVDRAAPTRVVAAEAEVCLGEDPHGLAQLGPEGQADDRLPDAGFPGHRLEAEDRRGHIQSEAPNTAVGVERRRDSEAAEYLEGDRVERDVEARGLDRARHPGPDEFSLDRQARPFDAKPGQRRAVEVARRLGRFGAAATATSQWQRDVRAEHRQPGVNRIDDGLPAIRVVDTRRRRRLRARESGVHQNRCGDGNRRQMFDAHMCWAAARWCGRGRTLGVTAGAVTAGRRRRSRGSE